MDLPVQRQSQATPERVAARIDRMPFTPWHGRLLAILGSAHFMDAFDVTAIAFVLPVLVQVWKLTPTQVGVLIAASSVGQMFGAIAAGMIAERAGRLFVIRVFLAILSIMSLACACAPGLPVLVLLRVLQGVGLGGETPIAATYLNEMAPARFRGRMVTAIQLLFGIGALAASVAARLLIPSFGWRSLFIAGALPILLAVVLRRLLPESPRWLAAKGRSEEAEAALAGIERAVFRKLRALPAMEAGPTVPRQVVPAASSHMGALLGRALLRPTLSVWLLAFCAGLIGYGVIGWMPTIYTTVYHLPVAQALSYSIATSFASLAGVVVCLLVIDWIGRKPSLVLGFAGAGACLAGLAYAGPTVPPVLVMVLATTALGFLALPLAGIYIYGPELYPTHLRALGTAVASAWVRVATIIGPTLIGLMLTYRSVQAVFACLAAVAATGAIAMLALGRETRTKESVLF